MLRQTMVRRKLAFVLGEGVLIFGAIFLAAHLFFMPSVDFLTLLSMIWPKIVLVSLVTQFSLYFNDLYGMEVGESNLEMATRLTQAIGMASIILAMVYFVVPDAIIGQWIFFLSLIFLIAVVVSWRFLYNMVITRKLFMEKAVLVGGGDLAQNILSEMDRRKDLPYDIRCLVRHPREQPAQNPRAFEIPVIQGFEGICSLAEEENASTIIVAMDEKRGLMPYKELLECKVRGLNVVDGEGFYERITSKLLVERINPSWLIFSSGFRKGLTTLFVKRAAEIALAVLMLIILSPLLLLVAAVIKLDTKGSAIFSQERVGQDQKPFMLHKFRSMVQDAEKETGPVWAEERDPRVTRVGRVIRKLRIDEFPQLWNVLKGEMSFVGPRPERAFFVERLKKIIPYYAERFVVKPGVTGWAQIKYPYGSTEEDALEKLKYDLYYIKNMSLVLDFLIMFQTVKIVLLGRGSR